MPVTVEDIVIVSIELVSPPVRAIRFAKMDANGDGSIAHEERVGVPEGKDLGGGLRREMMKQKMQENLQQMDTNGDGVISKTEFMTQTESRFAKMDANGDGSIAQEERAEGR